jgi:hypothetical protein
MLCRYYLWALTTPLNIEDKRVRREDRRSFELTSAFQRAVGVRYKGNPGQRYPNTRGGYGGFGHGRKPTSVAKVVAGFFQAKPLPRHRLKAVRGTAGTLAGATGYALLSAKTLRQRSVRGLAKFIGTIFVRPPSEA